MVRLALAALAASVILWRLARAAVPERSAAADADRGREAVDLAAE